MNSSWQPMETAPKDGTKVLIAIFSENDPEIGRWTKVFGGAAWVVDECIECGAYRNLTESQVYAWCHLLELPDDAPEFEG